MYCLLQEQFLIATVGVVYREVNMMRMESLTERKWYGAKYGREAESRSIQDLWQVESIEYEEQANYIFDSHTKTKTKKLDLILILNLEKMERKPRLNLLESRSPEQMSCLSRLGNTAEKQSNELSPNTVNFHVTQCLLRLTGMSNKSRFQIGTCKLTM